MQCAGQSKGFNEDNVLDKTEDAQEFNIRLA